MRSLAPRVRRAPPFACGPQAALLVGAFLLSAAPASRAADIGKIDPPTIASGSLQQPLVILSQFNVATERAPASALLLCRAPIGDRANSASMFVTGQLQIHPPDSDTETIALVVGPRQNGGDLLRVVALEREGRRLTIVMEHWRDNLDRHPNVPVNTVCALSLGKLPQGEHLVECEFREMFWDAQKKERHYRPRALFTGSVRFDVRSSLLPGAIPSLAREKLVEKPAGEAAGKRRLQIAYPTIRGLAEQGPAPNIGGIRAGCLDLGTWRVTHKNLAPLPTLDPPQAGRPVYALVLGPQLNVGERMELRGIEWLDRRAILRMEVWREAGAQPHPEGPQRPVLVVPLTADVGDARRFPVGDWQVEIEWTLMFAPTPGGTCRRSWPREIAADRKAHSSERAFLDFTRRTGTTLSFTADPPK